MAPIIEIFPPTLRGGSSLSHPPRPLQLPFTRLHRVSLPRSPKGLLAPVQHGVARRLPVAQQEPDHAILHFLLDADTLPPFSPPFPLASMTLTCTSSLSTCSDVPACVSTCRSEKPGPPAAGRSECHSGQGDRQSRLRINPSSSSDSGFFPGYNKALGLPIFRVFWETEPNLSFFPPPVRDVRPKIRGWGGQNDIIKSRLLPRGKIKCGEWVPGTLNHHILVGFLPRSVRVPPLRFPFPSCLIDLDPRDLFLLFLLFPYKIRNPLVPGSPVLLSCSFLRSSKG